MNPEPAAPSPSSLARHRQNWQRKVRRCITKVRQGSEDWCEAQSEGLRAANRLANDLVLLKAFLLQSQSAVGGLEKSGGGELSGLRDAAVEKLRRRARIEAREVERAHEKLGQCLEVLTAGARDLKVGDTLAPLDEVAVRRLRAEQSVYWTLTPNSYLKKVEGVVRCYEKEYEAKTTVLSFLIDTVDALQSENIVPNDDLEDKLKVQLVAWMLEPELDLVSLQDLEDTFALEKGLCKQY